MYAIRSYYETIAYDDKGKARIVSQAFGGIYQGKQAMRRTHVSRVHHDQLIVITSYSIHYTKLYDCLASHLGDCNFRYAATAVPINERVKMGWNATETDPWILRAGEDDSHRAEFERWWNDADVVIAGYSYNFV